MDYTGQSLDRGQDGPPKLPEQPLDTDFAKKFPPDTTLGDEIGETARVWKVYRAEAEAQDNTMLDGWNKTLDVHLIFAGLFSAVATAFLIDSYKLLRPDYSAAYMSTALYLLVMRDNISSTIPLPPPPPLATSASAVSVFVNILWFASLLLSLFVALLCILTKQWIVQYNARIAVSGQSPREWAIRRQMYFNGIWILRICVSILPVMLHGSLFLFFAGLALYMWNLDAYIGLWVSGFELMIGVFYMACSLLPLWIPECATAIPIFNLLRPGLVAVHISTLQLRVAVCTLTARMRRALRLSRPGLVSDPQVVPIVHRDNLDDNGQSDTIEQLMSAISSAGARLTRSLANYVPEERVDDLIAQALLWVMFSVADSDAHAVGMQALGAVPSHGAVAKYIRRHAEGWQAGSISSPVLLFLRARHLDFTNLVIALLWCDFSDLLHEDWTFVLERIVSEGSTRTSLRLLPCTNPLVCIVDVLSQCIMQNTADRNNMAVHGVLISLLQRISHFHGSKKRRESTRIGHSDQDHIFLGYILSAYLVSDSFAEQHIQSRVLEDLISTVLRGVSEVVEAYPPAIETYLTLLSTLLPLLWRQQGKVPDNVCVYSDIALRGYSTPGQAQDCQMLALTLRRILMPTDRQPLLSIWDMLRGMYCSRQLANSLARTLCLAERSGEDVSPMVDIFLSQLSLQELFEMHRAYADYHRREGSESFAFPQWVTPILQKCVDLRPAWWFESLSALRGDESAQPELKECLHELEAISLYRGICDRCHRLPRGWEDDDDPPSLCGFNPASPGPSTVPPSMSTPDARTPWYCSLCYAK